MGLLADGRASSRFELLAPLGRGGFGAVYEARDLHSGQRVALKELGQPSGDNLARFKQEFRALADLHHENLVGLSELLEQDGKWFIVMELIEGHELLGYVRERTRQSSNDNAPDFDEARLRGALAGMAQGLLALHEFGVLHRDLKPSNVRVSPQGRAVLLDFGLVTSVDPNRQSTHGLAVGTVAYMAPEQAVGAKIGPAADWYALGVCLFEALTDRLPFEGSSGFDLLLRKQQHAAPRASEYARALPPDLDELCRALLERDPVNRPSGREVLRTLGVTEARPSVAPGAVIGSGAAQLAFAGREAEIENLQRALRRTDEGELRVVLVEGESGVGKSELVAEFLRGARLEHVSLLTLAGRCYENEQVPYKAFDGCVDELAKVLRRLPDEECQRLLPERAALLGQLFPVLSHVNRIARASRAQLPADPTARRLEAFGAFAELLSKLAEERPLVLVIDDLQWADLESFRLLKALVEHRVRPPLLVLATVRPREELEPEVLEQVEKVRSLRCTDVQPLHGLPKLQAEALARSLLGAQADDPWIRTIAEESRGHPLLLGELVHFARSRELTTNSALSLDDALAARLEALERPARELVELVAVAARPCGSQIFAQALALDSVDDIARPLLMGKLLRKRKGQELGCYHDRIRHAAVRLIPRTRLPVLHRKLALAFANDEHVDPAELARHWELSGESERALEAYEKAAEGALEALAFLRAAELSEQALQSLGRGDPRYGRLLVLKARALACAGRSADAAILYERAAELSSGDERIRLRGNVANHLLLSAQIEKGLSATCEVLAELSVSLPLATGRALLRFAWHWFLHRTYDPLLRRRSSDETRDRLALDVIALLGGSIVLVHLPAYLALNARHVRLAALLSDPAQLALSYAIQGGLRTLRGGAAAGRELFEKSRKLSDELDQPQVSARQALTEGSALLTAWKASEGAACLARSHELLQAHCPDQPRELTRARVWLGLAWWFLGELRCLEQTSESWLREAHEREDHLGVALLVGAGCGYLRHLMQDQPERALAELDQTLARIPAEPFGLAQFGHLFAYVTVFRYMGSGSRALSWLDDRPKADTRQFVLRAGFGKDTMLSVRTMAQVQAAAQLPEPEQARALRTARALAKRLAKSQYVFLRCMGRSQLIQLTAIAGRHDTALRELRELQCVLPREFRLSHIAYQYLEGVLEASPSGREKCRVALRQLEHMGWKNPERALVLDLPALPLLMRGQTRVARKKSLLGQRYEVLDALGSGGFGNVVRARDTLTGRQVALKELTGKDARALERFKREFRALQTIHQENLAELEALFEHDGLWYIALELVEGGDLFAHVRPNGRADLTRVREAFAGLARGLAALHEAGFVHNDLSPVEIRISHTGRAILCDFGSIAQHGEGGGHRSAGAATYAAPEQLYGAPANAAADLYALGACLYEALVGEPPFRETTPHALLRRKREALPSASDVAPSAELALAQRMLDPDPERRPSLSEVLKLLSPLGARDNELARASQSDGEHTFAGRSTELARLTQAFAQSRSEGLTVSIVRGESGLGKSSLMSEFARVVRERAPDALVLNSRCYENEQVALKAFDDAVDQLARVLSQLPESECNELFPKRAALLTQLFPVLAWLPVVASATKKGLPAEPAARRLAALECFFELLERVSARSPLVFLIDDLQWADAESFRLLQQLLRQRSRLPILIACTCRPHEELEGEAARELDELCARPSVDLIELTGLDPDDAARYARQLLVENAPDDFVRQLVLESKGHPLFMRELVTRALGGNLSQAAPSLDDAVRARLERLDVETRSLLVLVALAGRPIRAALLAAAMERAELPRETVLQLIAQSTLVRRGADELSFYHDRLRQAALTLFDESRRRELARRLAQVLEAESASDAAQRAQLWDYAGEVERAVAAYERAGDEALTGLTFAQAERLYARALSLIAGRTDELYRRICVQRGHALVRMGQSADAARQFQEAASIASGELHIRLCIWAAQQLIESAQVAEGLAAAGAVLAELELPLPLSERSALGHLAWNRTRIALRGTKLRSERRPLSARERLRLDALTDLSAPVRAVSYLPGSTLVVQYLRRALDSGVPEHSARALAYEALWRSVRAPDQSSDALSERAAQLAEECGDPAVIAEVALMRGLSCSTRHEFQSASGLLWIAHELLQTQCPDQPWLLTSARMYLGQTWIYSGEYRLLAQHTSQWLEEARAKHDRYAFAAIAGFGCASYSALMAGKPEGALALLDEAMAPWPDEPFTTHHFGAAMARGSALAQMGGDALLSWLRTHGPRLERAYLFKTPTPRLALIWRHCIACLNAIPAGAGAARHPLFAESRRHLAQLARLRPGRLPLGAVSLVEGTLSLIEGRATQALAHARRAQAELSGVVFMHAGRYLEGAALGGEQGRALRESTLTALRAEGWTRPSALLRELLPGVDLI